LYLRENQLIKTTSLQTVASNGVVQDLQRCPCSSWTL